MTKEWPKIRILICPNGRSGMSTGPDRFPALLSA